MTDCWAVERKAVSDNGLMATYYYKKDSTQQPPVILFGGSSGGNFNDNYQNYPQEPLDIARAAVWLASDASDYVHGTSLFVDGGITLSPEFADGG